MFYLHIDFICSPITYQLRFVDCCVYISFVITSTLSLVKGTHDITQKI